MGRCINRNENKESNETEETNEHRWIPWTLWFPWFLSPSINTHTTRSIRYTPTMHFGRSHHMLMRSAISMVGGFMASFLAFVFVTATQGYHSLPGQLVAGDPSLNRRYPTTLNTMQDAMSGNNAMIESFRSELWWIGVGIGTIICAIILFRMVRRYV
jgi:hypothetical protein